MGDNSEDFLDVLTAVQEGEFEVVQEVIGGRFVSANALDRTGCSLLHWAAINNRVVIARLLIEHGLTKASPGGVLGETPLHWAMRKKYYIMMELIFKHTQCDLSVKSTQGNDALLLACKLGDVNAAFLLLHWGANVETTDLNGDTPLLWLIRNKSTVPGTTAHEIIKLLLRFGASTLAANPADGNNALHVLVTLPKIDLKTSFLLYQAAGPTGKLAVNKNNLTPYQLAVSTDRREMARFLYDAMMYDVLPYWSPTAAAAVLMAGLFFSIKMCGIIYGSIYWAILYTASSWTLLQWQVSDHRTRSTTGAFVGVLVCQLLSYRYNISHSVSNITNYITLAVVVVYLGSIFYFTRRKPLACNKAENRAQLAEQVLQSSPTEGTDEEFHLNNDEEEPETVDESSTLISKSSSVDGMRFVKDSFTGQLRRVDSNAPGNTTLTKPATTSTTSNAYHGRGLGPKLCGACLCDRRIHTTSSNSSVVLPTSLENYFLPPTGSSKTTGRTRTDTISGLHTGGPPPGEVIAIATHCASCDVCVVDQDHHSVLLGNCVGKGNRRLYWLFLVSGTLFCLIYFLTAKYVQHYETCADDAALMSGYGPLTWLRVEYCVLTRKGAFFALSWITAYLGFYLLVMLQIQVTCVVRETTYSNVTKQRYERMPPPSRRRMRTLLTFLYSGMYNVVYPKTSTRSRNNSMTSVDGNGKNTNTTNTGATTPTTPHKHDGCCGAPPAPVTSDSDKLQYERAMKMLKGIDLAISGKVEDEEVPDVESVVETVTGKSATTTYTAPVDLPPTPTATPNTGGCGTHDCSHCEDEFSDYDTEFIESAQNNYATYYFQDSGDEGDHSSGPSAKNGHSSGAILDHSSGHDHGHGHASGGHVHTAACSHDHSHGHSTSPYSTHNHSHDHSHSSSSNLKSGSSKNSLKNSKNNSTSISADDRV